MDDGGYTFGAYRISSLPTTFMIDKEGNERRKRIWICSRWAYSRSNGKYNRTDYYRKKKTIKK